MQLEAYPPYSPSASLRAGAGGKVSLFGGSVRPTVGKEGCRWGYETRLLTMFYFDLLEQFYKNNIRYLIVGGLAVNLYGVPRVTQDLDIVIAIETENILRMNGILKELGYVPRLPVNPDEMADPETVKQWTEERNLKAFSFYHKKDNYKVLDIVLDHPLDFEKAFMNKTVKSAGGIDINLVSIDNLITMKTASGRGQDISDIAMLERVRKYLEEDHG